LESFLKRGHPVDLSSALKALPIAAAIGLTPLVIRLLGWLFPPTGGSAFETRHPLDRHNGWINAVGGLLCCGGLFLPLILFGKDFNRVGWPALGLGFGSAIILPCAWIGLATLPFGWQRFRSFLRYYERKYKIGLAGVVAIYVPLALVGVTSVIELFRTGVW
jgi:hypothetical protein